MTIWEQLFLPEYWQEFLNYKLNKQHLSGREQEELAEYIEQKKYLQVLSSFSENAPDPPLPIKKEVNKSGVAKKRVVYSFPNDFNMVLKLLTYLLFRYDHLFAPNCYAFRRQYGARDAVHCLRRTKDLHKKYCLKVDISNYFNSIDVPLLLEKLRFLEPQDSAVYNFLVHLLTVDKAIYEENGRQQILTEERGAMAGTPISPFLANVYLMEMDHAFEKEGALYFRYSDDILLFADTEAELAKLQERLYSYIETHKLALNPSKVHFSKPGDGFDFLGFSFKDYQVDLSRVTIQKMKDKIKRKAHALRRWQHKKELSGDRAAKGFIKAMNRKFYDKGDGTEFSWSRWFFPCLTTDEGLKEIDAYMQQYIRYCVTGRHYKGNYRTTYQQMKEWGYRSLVHEYYGNNTGRA